MLARMVRFSLATVIVCVLTSTAQAQTAFKQFVIDESKPYVYIKYDHIGPREPANSQESARGLWLRLVNNCSIPIKISVFQVGEHNPGVAVNFEVVRSVGRVDPDDERHGKMPFGYNLEIGTLVTIQSKGDLLFSVPAESVTKLWSINVRFDFDLPEPKGGYHPYSVVDFTWYRIPEENRR